MEISGKPERKASPTGAAIDIAIRLGVLAVLVAWCFQILRPFVSPIVWGIIIAVALYPVYQKLNAKLGDRRKLSAAIMTLSALLIIIIPGVQLAVSSVDSLKTLNTKLGNGELKVPPPPEGVGNLPFIGESVKNPVAKGFRQPRIHFDEIRTPGKSIRKMAAEDSLRYGRGPVDVCYLSYNCRSSHGHGEKRWADG